ncbi:MAG: hypothetical protein UX74_C0040G0002 [Parcubacteria group bacterium GW2011_GWA2_47_10b]|nr:MAG: hypothetical protein UX74_C0040G0002 [Parcubacteria group bacterium GW2011_GWA2_47_10b]
MGKHERQQIEGAERIIVKILNAQKLNNADKENVWFEHALALAKRVKGDFPNIQEAKHLGNRYDNIGDILIVSDNGQFFIEIKMSASPHGTGTKANISQDALTENNLFVGKPKSWSEFRDKKGHEKIVDGLLNKFPKYPKNILKIENPPSLRGEKARYLRKLAKNKKRVAVKILNNIHGVDKAEKIEYLNYLKEQKQLSEMIKRFFVLIKLGVHRKDELKELMGDKDFFDLAENLLVYYSNLHEGKILISKEDVGKKIKDILGKSDDFRIIFPNSLTHCKLIGFRGNLTQPLLQIVLHWKNIAQGIMTPCLNIFDLTARD